MPVFFDTEFTGLTSDRRLLSIGLLADNGVALYLEQRGGAMCGMAAASH